MKHSTLLLLAVLTLAPLGVSVAQVTNLTVNGSTTNFTMTSGDVVDWSYNLPVGETADGRIYIDVNGNHTIDVGTDINLFTFSQTDGNSNGNGGPPDIDGLENGAIHFAQAVGLAPATYVMEFTNNSVSQSIWGVVNPLASPTFTVSGTVTGPVGVDLEYIVVEAQPEGEGDGDKPFWHGLTDSLGGFTVAIHSDTSGETWHVRINQPPYPYTTSPQDTTLTISGDITGINFALVGSAAQVLGTLRTDAGDSLAFTSLYISRQDSGGSGVFHDAQTDASGHFWFGIPLSELNGGSWRIAQSDNNQPITAYMLASVTIPPLSNGDSVVHDLVAYSVNSSIDGFVQIDGNPPGFPITLYASNPDSGESFVVTDSATGSFSIPVSTQVYSYGLSPNNLFGSYQWPNVVAHPGDAGVIYNITTTGVDDPPATLPDGYYLGQNYPNPFNPLTTITYGVPARSHVLLTVYDMLGREVATLVNSIQEPGAKSVSFDAASLPSGVYTYRIVSNTFTDARKMLVIK
jgi:hypothetical protein